MIPEVHLQPKAKRSETNTRAFPLNETNQPRYCDANTAINWLDVEHSSRYKRTESSTFCNIYAYDFAYLMGAYLPRVFWTDKAIKDENFEVQYGKTVSELSANSLYDWFKESSNLFGWSEVNSIAHAQELANEGRCVIAVSANKNRKHSGHIVAIVPETDVVKATKDSNGMASIPVQSQAGAVNHARYVKKWWNNMEHLHIYTSNHIIIKHKKD